MDRYGLWLLLGVTLMTYAGSLSGWYVYEDIRPGGTHVYQDRVASLRDMALPRSLTRLSHMLTARWFGEGPRPARTVSLAWHLLNGVLLSLVASRLLMPLGALVAVGLFLFSPIQSEAVASVAYRSELIVATFVLVALWCVQRGWLIPAFLCAVGAVTGKEAGIMAVALVPLWAWWTKASAWTPIARVYWCAAAFPVLLLLLDRSRDLWWMRPEGVNQTAAALVSLLALVVWPSGLTIDHDWAALSPWMGAAALVLLAGALETGWRRRWPHWAFALLFTLVALLPRFVWQLGEGLHEHHLYTATPVLSLAMGRLFTKDWTR